MTGPVDEWTALFVARQRTRPLRELYAATDMLIREAERGERAGDADRVAYAERRLELVEDEIDRRLMLKIERERRREAKILADATRLLAEHGEAPQ